MEVFFREVTTTDDTLAWSNDEQSFQANWVNDSRPLMAAWNGIIAAIPSSTGNT